MSASAAMIEKVDLTNATGSTFARLMGEVTRLGVIDAIADNVERTPDEIMHIFCTAWRRGHRDALKAAYKAGRFHVTTMGMDQ